MNLKNLILPHPKTHQRALLISAPALALYLAFFIFLQIFFSFIQTVKPKVLGMSSNVSAAELIGLTNQERQKNSLPPLSENNKLNQTATAKAKNMFEENYWAHYSPSGRDPWGFFHKAGYRFSHAGENLARNFYNSNEVIRAWMASPTHRDNLLNSNYKEIGIAVLEGTLGGQPTILVVQEFGTPSEGVVASVPEEISPEQKSVTLTAGVSSSKKIIDPFLLTKELGFSLILLLITLLALDLYIIRRIGVIRVASRHLPHLAFLAISASALVYLNPGAIL